MKAALRDRVDAATLDAVGERYSIGVSDHLLDRMGMTESPVARQYLPDIRELSDAPQDRPDPIGDQAHSPVKGIVHRYPNRALLMPLEVCAVYCRFCFRREKVGQDGHGLLSPEDLRTALGYIGRATALREIILTGGDPFVLSPRRMAFIVDALNAMSHIRILRFHTRVPVADPARVTEELCALLSASSKPIYVVIHVNHMDEMDARTDAVFAALRRASCILLSQSVLLKGVNDNADALVSLFQGLVERGVKPYYLHHPDLAPGTSHFRLSPDRGQALMKEVRGQVSGLAMPTYVLDIPGGYGKVPIGACHLERRGESTYSVEDSHGHLHSYDPGAT